jgi:putative transposase
MKRELCGGAFWADGYCMAKLGEHANLDTVDKYDQEQGQRKAEFRQIILFQD